MTLRASAGSAPDPYTFKEFAAYPSGGNKITSGKTVADPRLVSGENTGVFVVAGQSNACNGSPGGYTPTNATKVDNLNIYDGGTYRAVDPLLGCHNIPLSPIGVGNLFTRAADKLVTDGVFDRVILIPVGIGGSTINDWITSEGLYHRLIVAGRRAAAVGLTITAYLWMQGESDHGTSQANYASRLATLIAVPRNVGFTAPWLVGKCTYLGGATDSNVRAAQAGVVNGADIFAGADTDTLTGTGTYRQTDNTHFKDAGRDAAGDLWAAAINAVF